MAAVAGELAGVEKAKEAAKNAADPLAAHEAAREKFMAAAKAEEDLIKDEKRRIARERAMAPDEKEAFAVCEKKRQDAKAKKAAEMDEIEQRGSSRGGSAVFSMNEWKQQAMTDDSAGEYARADARKKELFAMKEQEKNDFEAERFRMREAEAARSRQLAATKAAQKQKEALDQEKAAKRQRLQAKARSDAAKEAQEATEAKPESNASGIGMLGGYDSDDSESGDEDEDKLINPLA